MSFSIVLFYKELNTSDRFLLGAGRPAAWGGLGLVPAHASWPAMVVTNKPAVTNPALTRDYSHTSTAKIGDLYNRVVTIPQAFTAPLASEQHAYGSIAVPPTRNDYAEQFLIWKGEGREIARPATCWGQPLPLRGRLDVWR